MIRRDARQVDLERRTTAVSAILSGVLVVLIIQLWLITVALEAHLAANRTVAVPTFIASIVCFVINLGLLRFLYRLER